MAFSDLDIGSDFWIDQVQAWTSSENIYLLVREGRIVDEAGPNLTCMSCWEAITSMYTAVRGGNVCLQCSADLVHRYSSTQAHLSGTMDTPSPKITTGEDPVVVTSLSPHVRHQVPSTSYIPRDDGPAQNLRIRKPARKPRGGKSARGSRGK
jgi:hypothetical protein